MLNKLREFFRRKELVEIPLEFDVDFQDENSIVKVFYTHDNIRTHIALGATPIQYGESIEMDEVVLTFTMNSYQILADLYRLDPSIDEDGNMMFPFSPPAMRYFRRRKAISETDRSQSLAIHDQSLMPKAMIGRNDDGFLVVHVGYHDENTKRFTSRSDAKVSKKWGFLRTKDGYYPISKTYTKNQKEWLSKNEVEYSHDEIPEFLEYGLQSLRENMATELTSEALRVRLVDEPLSVTADIDYSEEDGLQIDMGYRHNEDDLVIGTDEVKRMGDARYYRKRDLFYRIPDGLTKKEKSWMQKGRVSFFNDDIPTFIDKHLPKWKKKFSTNLTKKAESIRVHERPLIPKARIERNEEGFLIVHIGYQDENTKRFTSRSAAEVSKKWRYLRTEDGYYPISKTYTKYQKEWLSKNVVEYSHDEIPQFLEKGLQSLRENMETELSPEASMVRLVDEPLSVTANIDYSEEDGLQIDMGYRHNEDDLVIGTDEVKRIGDARYYRKRDLFYRIPDGLTKKEKSWMQKGRVSFFKDDIPTFIDKHLPKWKKKFSTNLTKKAESIRVHERTLVPQVDVDYTPKKNLQVKFGFGDAESGIYLPSDEVQELFDRKYTLINGTYYPLPKRLTGLQRSCIENGELIIPENQIPEFFQKEMVMLKSNFTAVLSENAAKIRLIEDGWKTRVKILNCDSGWLDFDVEFDYGHKTYSREELLNADGRFLKRGNYQWIEVDDELFDMIDQELEEAKVEEIKSGYRLPITHFHTFEEFVSSIGGIKEVTKEYQEFLEQMTDFSLDENYQLPKDIEDHLNKIEFTLRSYQRSGIQWMIWLMRHYLHGLLADDMGLGKTVQTILAMSVVLRKEKHQRHSIIVCPKSVVRFWIKEIAKINPGINTIEYVGINRDKSIWLWHKPMVVVTTYETLTRDIKKVEKTPLNFLILDEGTKIKNPTTKRTQAIKKLSSLHRIVLSGTPIENRPAELWSIFDFLIRGHLGTLSSFQSSIENPIIEGNNEVASELSKRIRPFILRRLKENIKEDLPDKIEMVHYCELTKEQKGLYSQVLHEYRNKIDDIRDSENYVYKMTSILPILTKLKQVCDHPSVLLKDKGKILRRSEKFDMVVNMAFEIFDQDENIVIFSHYLDTLKLLAKVFDEKDVPYIEITGSTKNRQELIDRFNEGKVRVALCSLHASGYGITLTGANHVFHVNRWWNPAIEEQATDRVHRIGQKKNVNVYKIIVEDTLEERIDELLKRKKNISDKVIDAATIEKMQWTKEELLEILKPIE